ncbi:hypothetical protein TNCV_492731 [Trichonephila clavipes]|nr:hypothetical protein TNCV_492731 [Trichonephila clavipes]
MEHLQVTESNLCPNHDPANLLLCLSTSLDSEFLVSSSLQISRHPESFLSVNLDSSVISREAHCLCCLVKGMCSLAHYTTSHLYRYFRVTQLVVCIVKAFLNSRILFLLQQNDLERVEAWHCFTSFGHKELETISHRRW